MENWEVKPLNQKIGVDMKATFRMNLEIGSQKVDREMVLEFETEECPDLSVVSKFFRSLVAEEQQLSNIKLSEVA